MKFCQSRTHDRPNRMRLNFPLFDILYTRAPTSVPDDATVKAFLDAFKAGPWSRDFYERVWLLIQIYAHEHGQHSETWLPYEAKQLKKGTQMNMRKLPGQLQWMLCQFLTMHRESEQLQ